MFQDALFLPDRHWRAKAAALPLAALIHAVALTLLATVPLLHEGDVPQIDISDVIVVPALPATPLPPPKARAGDPGARLKTRRAVVDVGRGLAGLSLSTFPKASPRRPSVRTALDVGIPGGVDYGAGEGLPVNLLGADLYELVGKPAEPAVLAVGDVKPPRLVRRIEPGYPDLAREAHIEGVVILEATTDIYGRVAAVRVLRGHALLDAAAIDAVRQWVYEPLLVNGRPRPVTFTVTVRFVLQK